MTHAQNKLKKKPTKKENLKNWGKLTPHTKLEENICNDCKWNKGNYCENFDIEIGETDKCTTYEGNGTKKLEDRIRELENSRNDEEFFAMGKDLELQILYQILKYR